jgi:hypothetical protein
MTDQTNDFPSVPKAPAVALTVPQSPLNSPDPRVRAAWQTQLFRIRSRNRAAQSNPQPGLVPGETLNKRVPL